MTEPNAAVPPPESQSLCSVVLICEDAPAHQRAQALCDGLARRFWGEVDFECKGWLYATLEAPESCFEAARAAASAGLVIFTARPKSELPAHVQRWIESWVGKRCGGESALISLASEDAGPVHLATAQQMYLRQVARRAGMDFLSDLSQVGPRSVPESLEWFSTRAGCVGSVMDDILKQSGIPRFPSDSFTLG